MLEPAEQSGRRFGVKANAGVRDLEADSLVVALHRQVDFTSFGELDCVRKEVGEHLGEAHRIAAETAPRRRFHPPVEIQALGIGRRAVQFRDGPDQPLHVELVVGENDFPGFDF